MIESSAFDNLLKLNNKELLKLYGEIILTLEARGVVRTQNSPIGDYTEWLVAKVYDYKLAANSKSGYDAISKDGKKIQIKSRRIVRYTDSKQLSAIRNLDKNEFDILIAIIYDRDCNIIEALSIPHEIIKEYAGYSGHVNSFILTITDNLRNDKRVKNIKEEITKREIEVNTSIVL